MSGSINIFNIRIKISPGKEINITVSASYFASLARNPPMIPIITPAIVNTSSRLFPNQERHCMRGREREIKTRIRSKTTHDTKKEIATKE